MAEEAVLKIIDGKCSDTEQWCDFSLEDQNNLVIAKGVTPTVPPHFEPTIGKNVCYIVAGILVNDKNEVLMIQEAKSSCAGQWYIPAGRVESGETLQEAVRREVLEETGLDFLPTTLLAVETAGGTWFRFVLTGDVVGGKLKTPADADSESLQAQWVSDIDSLDLRAKDIGNIITLARSYRQKHGAWHSAVMPTLVSHPRILMRLVVFARARADNRVNVLLSEKTALHLPVCQLCPSRSVHSTLKKFMTEIFGVDLPPHRPCGVLAVEFAPCADSPDGLCLTILVPIRSAVEESHFIDKYQWSCVSDGLGQRLLAMLGKNMIVHHNQIR